MRNVSGEMVGSLVHLLGELSGSRKYLDRVYVIASSAYDLLPLISFFCELVAPALNAFRSHDLPSLRIK
ncbi:26181_t:CDS:2 [Dentiscutata erythropus]|uniref:26181_t:CDS:1 n=1 Tax=Dentiscutata erythropus TaxID=1348616 RepID=A0A9N9BZC0_9GLOM|nr:26181_t:CDS:2 [Dentiscutata erythropus]